MPDQEKPRGSLFISHSRLNKAQVYTFADALTAAGVEVWIDREEIAALDDSPARIRDGLAHCHALLAWYSPECAQSSYCQKELTAAWICAQRPTRDVLSRILVVNPEMSVAHIALGDVGRQNYLAAPKDMASRAACISQSGIGWPASPTTLVQCMSSSRRSGIPRRRRARRASCASRKQATERRRAPRQGTRYLLMFSSKFELRSFSSSVG